MEVYTNDSRSEILATFHFLRQQWDKSRQRANLPQQDFCLADFVLPKHSGNVDYVGAFAVTAGIGGDEYAASREAANDDYNAILSRALADRLAEAFSERLHERVRREFWGYAPSERPRPRAPAEGRIPGYSARVRIPCLPRPHRECHAMEHSRRRTTHRYTTH